MDFFDNLPIDDMGTIMFKTAAILSTLMVFGAGMALTSNRLHYTKPVFSLQPAKLTQSMIVLSIIKGMIASDNRPVLECPNQPAVTVLDRPWPTKIIVQRSSCTFLVNGATIAQHTSFGSCSFAKIYANGDAIISIYESRHHCKFVLSSPPH